MMELWIGLLIFCSVGLMTFVALRALGIPGQFSAVPKIPIGESITGEWANVGQILRDRRLSQTRWVDRQLRQWGFAKKIQLSIAQAGLKVMTDSWILVCFASGLVSLSLLVLAGVSPVVASLLGLVSLFFPMFFLIFKKRQRLAQIESQLPDSLDSLARAMQAGNSFSGALAVVGRDTLEPLGAEIRLVSEEINFGSSTREGLLALADRVESLDIRYFVIAVLIHSQTGGNLAELLKSLASLIRDRQRLRKLGQALSAEGRLSAWILILMPFVTAALIHFVNPKFMSLLWTHPAGFMAVQVMLVLMVLGAAWMWRIVHFKI